MTKNPLSVAREIVTLLTMIIAIWQMLFTNAERSREHYETAASLYRLTQSAETQAKLVEAALKIDSNETP